jgi:hypothetical protein
MIFLKAKVKVLTELKREFEMLLFFEHDSKVKKLLREYVANRQIALIIVYIISFCSSSNL